MAFWYILWSAWFIFSYFGLGNAPRRVWQRWLRHQSKRFYRGTSSSSGGGTSSRNEKNSAFSRKRRLF
jgi:hypothetical protein